MPTKRWFLLESDVTGTFFFKQTGSRYQRIMGKLLYFLFTIIWGFPTRRRVWSKFWFSQIILCSFTSMWSGQIIIFHQLRFSWNKGIALPQLPFGVRSCEVAIIWPGQDPSGSFFRVEPWIMPWWSFRPDSWVGIDTSKFFRRKPP